MMVHKLCVVLYTIGQVVELLLLIALGIVLLPALLINLLMEKITENANKKIITKNAKRKIDG